MNPRVTVILSTYNWSSVLPYSIGSVLGQTLTDFELLVVGDCCTDDSGQVVAAVGDPRVRWINLTEHSGHQSGPNNEGIRQARGTLIAYLGHDDLWLPHHLASLVPAIDAGADLASSLAERVEPDGRVWATSPRPETGAFMPPSSLMHRRAMAEKLGGWGSHRESRLDPDVVLWKKAFTAGYRYTFVPRLTVIKFPASRRRDVYRIRPCHEQAAWSDRIASEPDFEVIELARMAASAHRVELLSYRELLRVLLVRTGSRFRRRLSRIFIRRPHGTRIRERERFKGLEEPP